MLIHFHSIVRSASRVMSKSIHLDEIVSMKDTQTCPHSVKRVFPNRDPKRLESVEKATDAITLASLFSPTISPEKAGHSSLIPSRSNLRLLPRLSEMRREVESHDP